MKKPIAPTQTAGVPMPTETCANCIYRDKKAFEGATKILCLRFPEPVVKRITDWCGEFTVDNS